MKTKFLSLVICMLCIAAIQAQAIVHDGIIRTYQVYQPPSYDPAVPSPLVINYHGLGSNAFEQRYYSGFDVVAADSNFIVVYPDGINAAWNSGLVTQSIADDVGFTNALIDKLSTDYNINQRKIYATGMSNGGFMSYRLACELENRIAAIASVTGTLAEDIIPSCQFNRPVPVMQIHGTADQVVSYNALAGYHRGAEGSVDFWLARNNCNTVGDTTIIPDIDPNDSSNALHIYYGPCDDGTDVEFYKIFNGGHTWPNATLDIPLNGNTNRDFDANRVIWAFFNKHSLPLGTNTEDVDESAFQFSIAPNPFSDELFLDLEYEEELKLTITDLLGHTVLEQSNLEGPTTLNLEEFASGVYFVTLSNKKDQVTQKVIKQ